MTVLNIAMIGSDELAKAIAKATDQRDVHTYVNKESGADGARILSIIRAAKMQKHQKNSVDYHTVFEERFCSFLYTCIKI